MQILSLIVGLLIFISIILAIIGIIKPAWVFQKNRVYATGIYSGLALIFVIVLTIIMPEKASHVPQTPKPIAMKYLPVSI